MTVLTDQIDRQLQARDGGIIAGVITAFRSLGYEGEELEQLVFNTLVYEFDWDEEDALIVLDQSV